MRLFGFVKGQFSAFLRFSGDFPITSDRPFQIQHAQSFEGELVSLIDVIRGVG